MRNILRKLSTEPTLVGKLQPLISSQEIYNVGQCFIHKTLYYRGVIIFGCRIPVYERINDDATKTNLQSSNSKKYPDKSRKFDREPTKSVLSMTSLGMQPELKTYYQVLLNSSDLSSNVKSENLTYLHMTNSPLVAVEGMDYVCQDDVLPYENMDTEHMKHFLLDTLFLMDGSHHYLPKETLYGWKRRNETWLKNSSVHRQVTNGVRVTVIPFYIGYDPGTRGQKGSYYWRYTIRIENLNSYYIQLRERSWKILSSAGTLEVVKGRGVVGEEPILLPMKPVYQYSSNTSLPTKSGYMFGTFKLERADGKMFDVGIPPFPLEIPPKSPD